MTISIKAMVAAAAATLMMGTAAQATTVISVGGADGTITAGTTGAGSNDTLVATGGVDEVFLGFTATDNITVPTFSITGNGLSNGADLANVRFELLVNGSSVGGVGSFDPVNTSGVAGDNTSNGAEFFPGSATTIMANQVFGIRFFEAPGTNIASDVLVDVTFNTIAPIPLPAAAPLLLAGLGGMAFVARRRKAAA